MKCIQFVVAALLLVGSAYPAQAQLFSRKLRLGGLQVPELLVIAHGDADERKRIAAIEQLREYDSKNYPEIVTNLIEVMHGDPRYNVRMEAMYSLVRLRPMTPAVAQALQQTAQSDDNWRVRTQTRTQIWVNGYHPANAANPAPAPAAPTTREPPLSSGQPYVPNGMPGQPNYVPGTIPGQPNYVPGTVPGQPTRAANMPVGQPVYTTNPPAGSARQMPSGPTVAPGYSTAVPQQPTEPTAVQMPRPLPQAPPAPLPPLVSPPAPVPPSSAPVPPPAALMPAPPSLPAAPPVPPPAEPVVIPVRPPTN